MVRQLGSDDGVTLYREPLGEVFVPTPGGVAGSVDEQDCWHWFSPLQTGKGVGAFLRPSRGRTYGTNGSGWPVSA
jgi:hypothetical protein